jgi:hypothetical protein
MSLRTPVTDPNEILALEHRRRAALVAQDKGELETLLSDELVFTHTNGMCEGKRAFIDSIGRVVTFQDIVGLEDSIVLHDRVAVISAKLAVTVKVINMAEPIHLQNRILSIWSPESTGWRQLAYQATKIES